MILRWKKDGMIFAIGTGRLTRNAEVKRVGEKNSLLVKLGVAVSETDEKEYASLDCWRRQAAYAQNLEKADDVFFFGIEKTRTYERDGEERSATSIDVKFIAAQMTAAIEEPEGGYHNSSASSKGAMQELPDDEDMPF